MTLRGHRLPRRAEKSRTSSVTQTVEMRSGLKANTEIQYMYRDADNYKRFGRQVLSGLVPEADVLRYTDDGSFIAGDAGLPELQKDWAKSGMKYPTDADHVFHEIESVEPTSRKPTCKTTAAHFLRRLRRAHQRGWPVERAMERLGLTD